MLDKNIVPVEVRVHGLLSALLPFFLAFIIVVPFIFALVRFHSQTLSAVVGSLFYSAHEYAQAPTNLLGAISSHFSVPGGESEFSVLWGFVLMALVVVFVFGKGTIQSLNSRELLLFKASAVVYAATVLASFGNYSVISDMVYYFVPQVGRMHVYQRFLIPAELVLGVIFAIMLKVVVKERPVTTIRIVWSFTALAFVLLACYLAFDSKGAHAIGLNDYLLIELLFALLFLSALQVPGKNFAYFAAIVLVALPLLDRMYDYSLSDKSLATQKTLKPVILNDVEKQKIVSFLKRHTDKKVIKYVDISPMWLAGTVSALYATHGIESFPKVFPDYVLNEIDLSSYGGFTFYLSAQADYMKNMPVVGQQVKVEPNWNYLEKTGADFLVVRTADVSTGVLGSWFSKLKKEAVYQLPNEVVLVPLRSMFATKTPDVAFDNGYFKIRQPSAAVPNTLVNIALHKPASESSNAGGAASLAVDGNTNGNFSLGSVSHTLRDTSAWLQIDLGASEAIDHVKIWNRTDCCGYCLRDYWLFISDVPYGDKDTADYLKTRPNTWGQQNFIPDPSGTIQTGGARGRYVRVQLPGTAQVLKECFLSLAEVEVYRAEPPTAATVAKVVASPATVKVHHFDTDHASSMRLEYESPTATRVEYQFWDNPRLNYYLDKQKITLAQRGGIQGFDVPPGRHTLEIKYRNRPLILFWVLYTLYAFVLLLALIPPPLFGRLARSFRRTRSRA